VGQVAAASPEPPREVGPGHVEVVEERRDRTGLLNDGEVGAGDVLDQSELEGGGVVGAVVDEGGDRLQPGVSGGPPAALAGDQLVSLVYVRPDNDGLQDAALLIESASASTESSLKRRLGCFGFGRI
jgi:hypothetical protein